MVRFPLFFILAWMFLFNGGLAVGQTRSLSQPNFKYADIVIEANTGRVLIATNAEETRHPASLAKIMTLYLTFQALKKGLLKREQLLPVSLKAASQEPTKLGLKPGDLISVENAIRSLVTQSANDAAVVLAEAMSGSERAFSQSMNEEAQILGMHKTHFYNASGLPHPYQVTTAADMAILGEALIKHFPEFYNFFSIDNFIYHGVNYHNHNHLMSHYAGMDGIKTGYIHTSGFNLVASVKKGSVRLIGVIFGGTSASSRDKQMAALLNEAFDIIENQSKKMEVSAASNSLAGKYLPLPWSDTQMQSVKAMGLHR